jgi:hypothetical protein
VNVRDRLLNQEGNDRKVRASEVRPPRRTNIDSTRSTESDSRRNSITSNENCNTDFYPFSRVIVGFASSIADISATLALRNYH